VTVKGDPVEKALRLPAATLSGRDRIWVVEKGLLASRKVRVLGVEGGQVILAPFDTADGVVAFPPADPKDGMKIRFAAPAQGLADAG